MSDATEPKHVEYPETLDLRRLTRKVQESRSQAHCRPVAFTGTVKVHGTNISILFRPNSTHLPQIQSRNKIITPASDNMDAAAFLTPRLGSLKARLDAALAGANVTPTAEIMVAGEYAGDKINFGAGVTELPRFYVVFAVLVDRRWLPAAAWRGVAIESARVFNIHSFTTFRTVVDFSVPAPSESEIEAVTRRRAAQVGVVQRLTLLVESECPVARKVGGLVGSVGEGIVWTEESEGALERPLRFKSKGPKHCAVNVLRTQTQKPGSKQKKKKRKTNKGRKGVAGAKEDTDGKEEEEKEVSSVKQISESVNASAFVDYAVTDARMHQGLSSIAASCAPPTQTPPPGEQESWVLALAEWLLHDVVKEEGDVLADIGLTEAQIREAVVERAREFVGRELMERVEGVVMVGKGKGKVELGGGNGKGEGGVAESGDSGGDGGGDGSGRIGGEVELVGQEKGDGQDLAGQDVSAELKGLDLTNGGG